MDTTEKMLALKAREVEALERIAAKPRPRDWIEAIRHYFEPDPSAKHHSNG